MLGGDPAKKREELKQSPLMPSSRRSISTREELHQKAFANTERIVRVHLCHVGQGSSRRYSTTGVAKCLGAKRGGGPGACHGSRRSG